MMTLVTSPSKTPFDLQAQDASERLIDVIELTDEDLEKVSGSWFFPWFGGGGFFPWFGGGGFSPWFGGGGFSFSSFSGAFAGF